MQRWYLNKELQKRVSHVKESNLVGKIKDLAEKVGEGGKTSKEWAGEYYRLEQEGMDVRYAVHSMGDKGIQVLCDGNTVLELKEIVYPPTRFEEAVVEVEGTRYEIKTYLPSGWENRLENLYKKHFSQVHEDVANEAKDRFGIVQDEQK